ncbi:hypothetical protein PTNB73_07648 [Pyrenophora teres f. teres]|nr:hypothetical protein PTNB85_10352 [Pyrenophora teres f. teres]KAE8832098.1 hypothetical protein HRS9139_06340 [Pyrenophora teres f. teres]KAE8835169.1 hypothetical protein HRS9122_07439 [Pyrenophora teres f. teres]KAE8858068.1 hypothetical protein PTNB29_07283 [Pyrenophora teres f. teres]KAE8862094.1 hypothetical protein PTNB73_07648 [Pyrenophora teres f. teres]
MYSSAGVANMANAVMNGTSQPTPSFERVHTYGAGAVEAADERLQAEIKARRLARSQAKSQQQVMRPTIKGQHQVARTGATVQHQVARVRKTSIQSLLPIDRELAKARDRREFLEQELKKAVAEEKELDRKKARMMESETRRTELEKKKAERDRKRSAAIARHMEATGGKPTGITKPAATLRITTFAQAMEAAAVAKPTGITKSAAALGK